MGVIKEVIAEGNGVDRPKKGDKVTMQYTGWLLDESKEDKKGSKFDSSIGRGPFQTSIGVGKVIKGWDEGILGEDGKPESGMTLGEKALLTITSDYAYGERGFLDAIPPNSTLIFEVQLVGIGNKSI